MPKKKVIIKAKEKGEHDHEHSHEHDENSSASTQLEQNKYMQIQLMDQQLKQLQQYLQTFDQQLLEIRAVISSLNELSKLKKGETILAPLASGIFLKAKLEDATNVRVNVGAGTVVTKTVDETIKMLEGQESEISQYRSDTMAKFEELMKQAEALQQ